MAARAWRNGVWVYREGPPQMRGPIPPAAVTADDVTPDITRWSAKRVVDWIGADPARARHALDVENTYADARATVVRHAEKVLG